MTALTAILFAAAVPMAQADVRGVPSQYTNAVVAVSLPNEDGPQYGIPAGMSVADEVEIDGLSGSISRFRRRRVQGIRMPVAEVSLANGSVVQARPLAEMVAPQPPPPSADGWYADDKTAGNILVLPLGVRAGSAGSVDGQALSVVAVARNIESNDLVVLEDDRGERRSVQVWWTR